MLSESAVHAEDALRGAFAPWQPRRWASRRRRRRSRRRQVARAARGDAAGPQGAAAEKQTQNNLDDAAEGGGGAESDIRPPQGRAASPIQGPWAQLPVRDHSTTSSWQSTTSWCALPASACTRTARLKPARPPWYPSLTICGGCGGIACTPRPAHAAMSACQTRCVAQVPVKDEYKRKS